MATTQTKSPNLLRNWTWVSEIISSNFREYVSKYTGFYVEEFLFFHMILLTIFDTIYSLFARHIKSHGTSNERLLGEEIIN